MKFIILVVFYLALVPAVLAQAVTDTFDDGVVSSSWMQKNTQLFTYLETGGHYIMRVNPNTVWFEGSTGGYTYRLFSGNVKVTTLARSRKRSNSTLPANDREAIQYTGIMLRNPASDQTGQQNYVFNVIGWGNYNHSSETKTTVNNVSTVGGQYWNSPDAELRVCRIGSTFTMFMRPVGSSTWQQTDTYTRSDLPSQLQVGMIAYDLLKDSTDFQGMFDWFDIQPVSAQSDCTKDSSVTPTPAGIPGDANSDGRVDGRDYIIWLTNYNTSTTQGRIKGDFNNNNFVDGLDYVIWLNNYN